MALEQILIEKIQEIAQEWGTRCQVEGLFLEQPHLYDIILTSKTQIPFSLLMCHMVALQFRDHLMAECNHHLPFHLQGWLIRPTPINPGLSKYLTFDLILLPIISPSKGKRCVIL